MATMATTTTEVNTVIAERNERKERKRTQNRLNQRARRLRLRESKSEKGRPYRVERWRLEAEELTSMPTAGVVDGIRVDKDEALPGEPRELSTSIHDASIQLQEADAIAVVTHHSQTIEPGHAAETWTWITPVLPADHLLSLIQLNVSRGLRQNKTTLWDSTFYYMPSQPSITSISPSPSTSNPLLPKTIHPDTLFYGSSLITTVTNPAYLPTSLIPTEPQMQTVHATWINSLPFPRMRENLIRFEAYFNHAEFLDDLVGDLVDTGRFFRGPDVPHDNDSNPLISGLYNVSEIGTGIEDSVNIDDNDDEITSTRNGLIIWGEPYRAESWEATPGFLRKWAWAVSGCEELIASTNQWRGVRGEGSVMVLCL
ncbi:hypothetical protein BJX66DRAFT_291397 [Aspergillus keveii]|uniref:BZIP domain-containing protein n=1 Tax=Aspergillus keveii TaxID=714993 RepID=A0ABR4GM75_9EURO